MTYPTFGDVAYATVESAADAWLDWWLSLHALNAERAFDSASALYRLAITSGVSMPPWLTGGVLYAACRRKVSAP